MCLTWEQFAYFISLTNLDIEKVNDVLFFVLATSGEILYVAREGYVCTGGLSV